MEPRVAERIGVVSALAVSVFVRKNQVDCDQMDADEPVPLYRYAARMPVTKFATQVLVFTGRRDKEINVGFDMRQLTASQAKAIWRAMDFRPGQKRLIQTVQQKDNTTLISLASTYGRDGKLIREGRFVQDQAGKILGKATEEIADNTLCDGCDRPTYESDAKHNRLSISNIITISKMPFPMMMEDSSTVEGRALTLLTFSALGRPVQFREYEYMVTCILGPDPNITKPNPAK